MVAGDDPRAIRSVAVTADDVVMALESNLRENDERTVLRITPPFSGRMRARLHVVTGDPGGVVADPEAASGDGDDTDPGNGPTDPIVIPPSSLVSDPPPYPHPDDTEDELRADPDVAYTPDRHHERHVEAVESWRSQVRDAFVDSVDLPVQGTTHTVSVSILG